MVRRVVISGLANQVGLNGKLGIAGDERQASDGRTVTHVTVDGRGMWVGSANLYAVDEVVIKKREGETLGMVLRGMHVEKVTEGGAAHAAGLRPGHHIEAVNGNQITDPSTFVSAVSARPASTLLISTRPPPVKAPPKKKSSPLMGCCMLLLVFILLVATAIVVVMYLEEENPRSRQFHQFHQQQFHQQQYHQQQRHAQQTEQVPELPDYYAALEVSSAATAGDIKSAFKRLSRLLHPDKGGDLEGYKAVREAYDVLIDERRRRVYDALGLNHEVSPKLIPHETGPDDRFTVRVTLDDVYNGAEHHLVLARNRITSLSNVRTCQACQLQPPTLQTVRMGPMLMQQHVPPDCRYQCHTAPAVKKKDIKLDFEVVRGMPEGHRIVFPHASDEYLDLLPADVTLELETVPHKLFRRAGDDLYMTLNLPLIDAVNGFSRTLRHMDGHEFTVASHTPTPHGLVLALQDEGMPKHDDYTTKGVLYVTIEVMFPKALDEKQKTELRTLFAEIPDQVVEDEQLRAEREDEQEEDE
eukprot:TRINITY_DN6152_c0_g1_i1.p1 TRINITY_DN6152_c0_g1~~TRINITY_DN6152_c0_g1_i1.p1  ORF type:complete len:537 (+),score=158.73 TRINITY_DN6152_c0_g1_i1:33-1613(+)